MISGSAAYQIRFVASNFFSIFLFPFIYSDFSQDERKLTENPFSFSDGNYHGINGNVSLDRRGELATSSPNNRYDLTLGSDKSSSLSRSEGGVYDVSQAEGRIKQQSQNHENIANNNLYPLNGTLELQNGTDSIKKKVKKNIFQFIDVHVLIKCIFLL